jgi:hypothetical protein
MTCRTCGRPAENGQATHWLGCEESPFWANADKLPDGDEWAEELQEQGVEPASPCGFGDCQEPRRSGDKRVKYCEEHSDPKNRK